MSDPKTFTTEQETFWSGSFGDAYTDRNAGDSIAISNLLFWGGVSIELARSVAALRLAAIEG